MKWPLHNGWIKRFNDGKYELGTDEMVAKKQASWSKGRLMDMSSVELYHNQHLLILEGQGGYWQSDDFDVAIFSNQSKLVRRRLQKEISEDDGWLFIMEGYEGFRHYLVSPIMRPRFGIQHMFSLDKYVSKWLTVELDVITDKVTFDFKAVRI